MIMLRTQKGEDEEGVIYECEREVNKVNKRVGG